MRIVSTLEYTPDSPIWVYITIHIACIYTIQLKISNFTLFFL